MIKAAAARHNGVVYWVPRPGRHDAVLQKIVADLNLSSLCCDEQGFITEDGKFVNRIEAADIAIKCEQIEKLNWPPNLYSEDLW